MAVHGCINQNFMDDDDDDGPVVFRRSNTTSKQIKVSSTSRNVSSQRQERTPAKPVSNRSPHLQNSRPATSAKVISGGSVATNKSSSVSTFGAPKHTSVHSKSTDRNHRDAGAYSDDSDDYKPLAFRHSAPGQAKSFMLSGMPADESDDSDDDKPLNLRIPPNGLGTQKSNVLPAKRPLNSSSTTSTPSRKMSEAGKPFSSKLSLNSNPTKSTKKFSDADDEKPLSRNFKQNGICKRDQVSSGMVNKDSNKRPLGDIHSSVQPSKKVKLSGSSESPKMKQETSVKKELNVSDVDDEDHVPIGQRLKKRTLPPNHQSVPKKTINKGVSIPFKKGGNITRNDLKNAKFSKSIKTPPGSGEGQKWTTLEHNGVIFPPPYKPHGVKMLYNGQPVDLTPEQEEVATMFAVMKDTDYATKLTFINNFMNDWRTLLGKNHVIKKFELCDFTPIYEWHLKEKEKKKQMSTEEKKALREEKLKQEEKYMWAIVDGVKEKVGNFRAEPPGLFRGRGEHPKMGKLKKRILPRDITINIGRDAPIPECPIPGERWKEIRHDNSVTWLAYWNDPINSREFKYVFLAASSSLKGQSDKEKYEKARKLKVFIHNIRENYTRDFTSKDETKRQIAVATYLIDKLALRAGNEKDDDEADTVGCCTLKVENVTLVPPNKLQFDFLGKDSIRYFNTVEVELPVYKAIGGFRTGGKKGSDDLFDKLDTAKLNAHLKELMPGLTAKVFRTYNASITLDKMLNQGREDGTPPERIAVYQHANKEVAIICNHQRSVSKSHEAQMSKLDQKIEELKAQQQELQVDLSRTKKGKPPLKGSDGRTKRNLSTDALEKKLAQIDAKIEKMELDKKIKDDLKTVALGTSKINYLDPRISVAWCKRQEVPIEKIFNKSLLAKFSWAMDTEPDYRF